MGGATPDETRSAESRLSTAFPGISGFTEYTGRGADPVTSGLGLRFNNDVPNLFSGQAENSVDAILANMPKVVEGAGKVSPETVTAATVGTSAPTGGVLQAGMSGPNVIGQPGQGAEGVFQQPLAAPLINVPNAAGPQGISTPSPASPEATAPTTSTTPAAPGAAPIDIGGGPGVGASAGPGTGGDAGTGGGPGDGSGDGGSGGYHAGGDVKGEFGAEKTATVQSGEFVVNKYAAQKYKHLLEVLNRDGQREAAKRGDKASTSPQAAQASKKHAGGGIYDAGGMVDDVIPPEPETISAQNADANMNRATAARVGNTPSGAPMSGTGDNPYMSAENPGQGANQKKIAGYAGQGGGSSSGGGAGSAMNIIGMLGILA